MHVRFGVSHEDSLFDEFYIYFVNYICDECVDVRAVLMEYCFVDVFDSSDMIKLKYSLN